MSEQPRYGAPSPADGPTTPGSGAVSRAELDAARDGSSVRSSAGPVDHPTTPAGGVPAAGPVEHPTVPDGAAAARPRVRTSPGRTRIGGAWIGLILGAVVLVFLLIFILQNLDPARVVFLGLEATLPLGIWLLFAAIAGMLLLAIPGLGRMVQWRRAAQRTGRTR
ncbi:LapA family protein [Actinomycetospora aeridis]|uniref:Lipopolysaccharide assembly protein LapA domain-containing protein n=1 Tax=Actinomycetospora aeridis TaxID=3129231 RepID=A0ABU8NEX0_9PSEU